ncbi:MAG: PepSY-associated TM helix domain-containing protein [Pseudomonadota bacterium]
MPAKLHAVPSDLASRSDQTIHPAKLTPTPTSRSRRGVAIIWLRKAHGWIGLWGATLGLLFGTTGILLNHRAVLKIPAAQTQESVLQIALPSAVPNDAQALANWLQHELAISDQATRVRSEPSRPVPWGDKNVMQPARWTAAFSSAKLNIQTEYWVGNNFVTVKRNDNNVFATLNNMHKGTGSGIGWILLADTLAGSIILLSVTGVLLWALVNRRRMVGAGIGLTALALTIGFLISAM